MNSGSDLLAPTYAHSAFNYFSEHSDPAKLKRMAERVQSGRGPATLEQQRARVEELMAEMATWPSEAELLQRGIDTLQNSSSSEADKVVALKFMQELVEDVDVANGAQQACSTSVATGLRGYGCCHVALLCQACLACHRLSGSQRRLLQHMGQCLQKRIELTTLVHCCIPNQPVSFADFLKLNASSTEKLTTGLYRPSSVELLSRALLEDGLVRLEALRFIAVAAANNAPFQRTLLRVQNKIVPWLLSVRIVVILQVRCCPRDVFTMLLLLALLHCLHLLLRLF
jgi:Nucleotide exchange factor Fes1